MGLLIFGSIPSGVPFCLLIGCVHLFRNVLKQREIYNNEISQSAKAKVA